MNLVNTIRFSLFLVILIAPQLGLSETFVVKDIRVEGLHASPPERSLIIYL